MKKTVLSATVLSALIMLGCQPDAVETRATHELNQVRPDSLTQVDNTIPPEPEVSNRKIKVALILDTSNSMDGLIEQAKEQLWKIVLQLAKATDEYGKDPEIELALYQYGNDNLSVYNGYIERVSHFTTELDEISDQLFKLTTNGGSEFCGEVIQTSLKELEWSANNTDLQLIFIAGNEPFSQGNIDYRKSCVNASSSGVVVNTIFCGDFNEGIRTSWKDGAHLGMGRYMNINSDAKTIHINTPYDERISMLNVQLNNTYVPYGTHGVSKKNKQLEADNQANESGTANAAKRYLSKSSKVYKNTSWDLVDKMDEKDFSFSKINQKYLPDSLQGLSIEEQEAYVLRKKQARVNIKAKMAILAEKRDEFVKAEKQKMLGSDAQLGDAILAAIVEQAEAKNFKFNSAIN